MATVVFTFDRAFTADLCRYMLNKVANYLLATTNATADTLTTTTAVADLVQGGMKALLASTDEYLTPLEQYAGQYNVTSDTKGELMLSTCAGKVEQVAKLAAGHVPGALKPKKTKAPRMPDAQCDVLDSVVLVVYTRRHHRRC